MSDQLSADLSSLRIHRDAPPSSGGRKLFAALIALGVVGAGGADGPQLNLELSQKRSMDVVRWSLAALEPGDERDCFRRLLSASGRGQEELLPDVAGDDSRQRRVVFKIRTQRDAADDLATGLVNTVGTPSIETGKR